MSSSEVNEIVRYCHENGQSYKERLKELGISPWKFYDAKRRYSQKEASEGKFLQLTPGNSEQLSEFFGGSRPIGSRRKRSGKEENRSTPVNIEMKTPSGNFLRIQGAFTSRTIQDIILASSGYVHP